MSAHRPPVGTEGDGGEGGGGGGGGSVQLLTGGRRVSQASPTLSLAILGNVAFRYGDSELRMNFEIHESRDSR